MRDEEITRALAEKVMGFPQEAHGQVIIRNRHGVQQEFWPLGDESDCAAVLDKMAADGWTIVLETLLDAGWLCRFLQSGGSDEIAVEDCRRMAICVAALKAVGAWEEDGCIFCGVPMEVVGHTERFGEVLRCSSPECESRDGRRAGKAGITGKARERSECE